MHPAAAYTAVYEKNNLFNLETASKTNLFHPKNRRPNSIAVGGGALGDEGKGR